MVLITRVYLCCHAKYIVVIYEYELFLIYYYHGTYLALYIAQGGLELAVP